MAPTAPDDVAMQLYTSGTTGLPKGAMLTHGNALATAAAAVRAEDLRPTDDWLAYLPMAWVGDAFYTLVLSLYVGFTVNCPESPETVQRDLRELGPTVVLAPPRIWENMLASVQIRAADAPWLKRWIFERCRRLAERVELLWSEGRPVPVGLRLAYGLGAFLVFGPVREGVERAKAACGWPLRTAPRVARLKDPTRAELRLLRGHRSRSRRRLEEPAGVHCDDDARRCP